VETALAAMEAWTRRDVEALLAFLDPEIEWHPALQTLLGGEAAVYRDTTACVSSSRPG
jgi:hypothetical protein